MDLQILQAHVAKCGKYVVPKINEDGSNLSDFFCPDVVGNRRFAQNYGGYPRSEIAEINAQASLQQASNLLNDLTVHEGSYQSDDIPLEDFYLAHKSKYIQAPSEQIRFIEEQLAIRDSKRRVSSKLSDGTIQFDSNDSNSEVND